MKTVFVVLMFAAAFTALYEQSLAEPNVYIMVPALVVFMVLLMRLMSKIPSKNEKDNGSEV